MQVPQRVAQLLARHVLQKRSYHSNLPKTTYNDLPIPSGSWKTHYDAQQRKYNSILLGGLAALCGTIIIGKAGGLLEFYNDYPARPATIENYKN